MESEIILYQSEDGQIKVEVRMEGETVWRIPAAEILQYDAGGKLLSANLDRKNPTRRNETEYAEPTDAIAAIIEKERQILTLMQEIQQIIVP